MGALSFVLQHVNQIPEIDRELSFWYRQSQDLPKSLRDQASQSIEQKGFHCYGGCLYALYPGANRKSMLRLIIALQTISDYLDNLCDQMNQHDRESFLQLHISLLDALDSQRSVSDYYRFLPFREDSYLPQLVQTCRTITASIPHYAQHQSTILSMAEDYCRLQAEKHARPNPSGLLQEWFAAEGLSSLAWNEWAAACGSTLGIFMLCALGYQTASVAAGKAIYSAYFPWIQCLHILLDYVIDRSEDQVSGELNFIDCYPATWDVPNRLLSMYQQALLAASSLPQRGFHRLAVHGLVALYGSDEKATGDQGKILVPLLKQPSVRLLHWTARRLRKKKLLTWTP